jgi:uncharacterized RDD family membrane protein YckC
MSNVSHEVHQTPADVPVRIASRLLDALILGAVVGLLGKVLRFDFVWLAAGTGIVLLYFVLMDVCYGATVGKFALGLRVTGPSGGRPTLRESLIWEAFTVLGAIPFVGSFLALGAWIWIFLTARSSPLRQGKHDMLAGGTRVVLAGHGRWNPQR